MGWFNYYGLAVMAVVMIPNIIYAVNAIIVYLAVNGGLCLAYLIFWIICRNKSGKLRALALSVIPSCIFIFSGVMLLNIPLICFAVIFAVSHILISYKNAV